LMPRTLLKFRSDAFPRESGEEVTVSILMAFCILWPYKGIVVPRRAIPLVLS
jgi:hypothetical protein